MSGGCDDRSSLYSTRPPSTIQDNIRVEIWGLPSQTSPSALGVYLCPELTYLAYLQANIFNKHREWNERIRIVSEVANKFWLCAYDIIFSCVFKCCTFSAWMKSSRSFAKRYKLKLQKTLNHMYDPLWPTCKTNMLKTTLISYARSTPELGLHDSPGTLLTKTTTTKGEEDLDFYFYTRFLNCTKLLINFTLQACQGLDQHTVSAESWSVAANSRKGINPLSILENSKCLICFDVKDHQHANFPAH